MDSLSSVFTSRVQGYQRLAKQAPANHSAETREFSDKFSQVTDQMMGLIQNKEAVFREDGDGNPVVSVPDLGSLKLTAEGCEMAILQGTIPFLSRLAYSLGSSTSTERKTGMSIHLDEKAGRVDVSTLQGEINKNVLFAEDSTSSGTRESFTLDTSSKTVVHHEVEDLGYRFADASFHMVQRKREIETIRQPLFERG
jgi:hypothetical protein